MPASRIRAVHPLVVVTAIALVVAPVVVVVFLPYRACACLSPAQVLERRLGALTGDAFLHGGRVNGGGVAVADDDPREFLASLEQDDMELEVAVEPPDADFCADHEDATLVFDFRGGRHPVISDWQRGTRAVVSCRNHEAVAARLYRYQRTWLGLQLQRL